MAPAIQRLLQTAAQKHNAAPTPFRKRRNLVPSPLVACPEIGIISDGISHKEDNKLPSPFRFRPLVHAGCEKAIETVKKPTVYKIKRDIKRINKLLPIDILMRSLKQQASRANVVMDPAPIRLKLCPQMRRVKVKKNFRRARSHRKKPESGRLIPRNSRSSITFETIMAIPTAKVVEANPSVVAKMLIRTLLDLRPYGGIHGSLSEVIALRRQILYMEEGAEWMHMFLPGARKDDEHIPPVFKLFDNTDKGIPEELMQKRNRHGSLTTYQFRVLAKRYGIKGGMDLKERILFGEILGMTEEAVHTFLLEIRLADDVKGMTERQIRNLFCRTFRVTNKVAFIDGENSLEATRMYERVMRPIIEEVFVR